jgi:hypothetical protein
MNRDNLDCAATVAVAAAECAAFAAHAPSPVTIILGLGLFAAPGYLWSTVILRRRPATLEGIAVASILALIVPIAGGLALYAAGIRLHAGVWVGFFAAATVIGSVVLAIQRRRAEPTEAAAAAEPAAAEPLAAAERVSQAPAAPRSAGAEQRRIPHAAAFAAAAVIAAGAVGLAVYGAQAQQYPGYTQLWLTPHQDTSSEDASLGVTNQQGGPVRYRLVLLDKNHVRDTWNFTLANGQTWQQTVPYTRTYGIAADLYKMPELSEPYREVDNGETT